MASHRIDLGCGDCKKKGTVGLDVKAQDGVDHVVDIEREPLPFPDRSVAYVHSSHFLEHLRDPTRVFMEVSRVAEEGARLEFWTPYTWDNSAFIIDHKLFYNEDHYLHICVWFTDFWWTVMQSRWLLHEIVYVIEPRILAELARRKIELDFAIRFYKGIVKEFGVFMEVAHRKDAPVREARRSFASSRDGARYPLPPVRHPAPEVDPAELRSAIAWLSRA